MAVDPLLPFAEPTRAWFSAAFDAPTPVQRRGWEAIARGEHALLVAPTGSGKTLAAFLWGIDALARAAPEAAPGVRLLYVSPLKALVYDVERNLRAPLAGVRRVAEGLGLVTRAVAVDVRTGDTPARDRRRQARRPADLLVTTPESLFLLLGSAARETLATVEAVIVDEVHALLPGKRGAHLALSLERLADLTGRDPQRIGLSATVRPLTEAAAFLGGDRPVTVVDATEPPRLDLEVTVPAADPKRGEGFAGPAGSRQQPGFWPALYPELLAEVRAHRSTIVFVNSRALCERLAQRLNDLAGEALVRAHHGSVSREQRAAIEETLKRGELRGLVATSSLELGIDMEAVDRVLLVESPGSVTRGLQRVGRAGHQVGAVSAGRLFPKFPGDLLECAVVARRMLQGELEAVHAPRNPLDVLAQQVVAVCGDRPRAVGEVEALVRRSHSYRELSRGALVAVLDMLSGRYPSTELADLRPLLAWDRGADRLTARPGAALVARLNAGTIPDRGHFGVFLGPGGPRVGELDEELVFETRAGENLLLGATTWRVEEITRDRVIVSPAPGEPGKLPFWKGDGPGRPVELGRALGAFVRELGAVAPEEAAGWLTRAAPLDRAAAETLAAYVRDQREHTGTLPTDRSITVERFRDELGDWRVCLLTPFGARVHAPWATAVQRSLAAHGGAEVQVMWSDDGIALRLADADDPPAAGLLFPDPEEVEDLVTAQVADTALFAGLFRENAARSLLLPRRRPGRRSPLWAQRLRAQTLLAAVRRYPAFPVVLETYRQVLSDVFDLAGLTELLRRVRSREVAVVEVETRAPSPFARSLAFAWVAEFLYDGDAPLAERRAQALTLDRGLLAELLGQAELGELIDPGALAELEAELQHRSADRRARDAEGVWDLLRRLGDLGDGELRERVEGDPGAWLAELQGAGRAGPVAVAGERRWIAAEDGGLYRDALGSEPPAGLPAPFLEPTERPLEQLLGRFARTRGPFLTREAAARFGLRPGQVEPALRVLEAEGRVVRGELRPGGAELEWCGAEVLRHLKRRTLARLRRETAPVDAAALGRLLPAWQGVGAGSAGPDALEAAVGRLEGLALPWSVLVGAILPARVADFRPEQLDLLSAAGRIAWVGRGSLGPGDGRVALVRRERAAGLVTAEPYAPPTPLHGAILEHLGARGASFYVEVEAAVRRGAPGATAEALGAALWDLVWAGQVTNDTFAPLRSLGRRAPGTARAGRRAGHPLAGGRWSLVRELADPGSDPTRQALARATALLDRYGVVSREVALIEDLPGGFGPVYRVLGALEEAGRVRRGYFVEGLSAAQFALPGAVERLRAAAGSGARALAAADPANPYGAFLPWPGPAAGGAPRPRRAGGAWVVLVGGRLALYLAPGGRQVRTFDGPPGDEGAFLAAAFQALNRVPRPGRRAGVIEGVDGVSVGESPHREGLLAAGFRADYRGVVADPSGPGQGT